MKTVFLNGETLTVKDVVAVARENAKVEIPDYIKKRVINSRRVLKEILDSGIAVYGVTQALEPYQRLRFQRKSRRGFSSIWFAAIQLESESLYQQISVSYTHLTLPTKRIV